MNPVEIDDMLAALAEDVAPEWLHWIRWAIDEYDPVNPYHDAVMTDGVDNYATDFPTRRAVTLWALKVLGTMPDMTHGLVGAKRKVHHGT